MKRTRSIRVPVSDRELRDAAAKALALDLSISALVRKLLRETATPRHPKRTAGAL